MDSQNTRNVSSDLPNRLSVAKDIQKEAARIHSEFQKTLSETHLAFLKSSEHCFELLLQGGEEIRPSTRVQETILEAKEEYQLLPSKTKIPDDMPVPVVHAVEPFRFSDLHETESVEIPVKKTESSINTEKILIDVIAEKTGYPQELIKVEMSLDTDLGIDSIKRVEIFSQLAEQIPQASSIDPQVMNKLSTLQSVLDFLDSKESLPSKKKSSSSHLELNA